MNQFGQDLAVALQKGYDQVFEKALTTQTRQKIAEQLFVWLSFTARKNQDGNLPAHLAEMRKRFISLSEVLELHYRRGKLVVKVSGDAKNTLRMLERGTDWFDPAEDATGLIAGAVLH